METSPGHIFNDTDNTIYLAGDTERPIYVTEVEGKTVYSDILISADLENLVIDGGEVTE